ncbi:FapA family protein [Agathobacter ruminis]|nr:FapA family protein [Agathobacter ruminis]MDC7302613.1 FapA family protein [Agathobacter ruminis]
MQVIIANYGNLVKKGEHVPKDKLIYAQKLAEQYKEENAALLPLKEEIAAIHQEMLETDGSYVIVSQIAYPGVTIAISDISMNLKDNRSHTKFHKAEGEVKADIY